jgi:orotidine-5'-phosphate decarboxylase
MHQRRPEETIIIALDVKSLEQASSLVETIGRRAVLYKVGSELFTCCGPPAVKLLRDHGKEVFLDLKFHDIPNTVAGAVAAAAGLGVKMLNVHASGGLEMMKAGAEAAKAAGNAMKVLAVTVLTSIDEAILREDIGCRRPVEEQVVHLAKLARRAGLDGVVASPKETGAIRQSLGRDFLIVTPGIRPNWAAKGDQKRVTTPAEAIQAGADYIVIGRPVTGSDDPERALERILAEISGVSPDDRQ